jgi:hypothetical protein
MKAKGRTAIDPEAAPKMGNTAKMCERKCGEITEEPYVVK